MFPAMGRSPRRSVHIQSGAIAGIPRCPAGPFTRTLQPRGRPGPADASTPIQPAGLSFGSHPAGQPQERRLFHLVTPGTPNDPGPPAIHGIRNEWMAANEDSILPPAVSDPHEYVDPHNVDPFGRAAVRPRAGSHPVGASSS